MADQGTEGLLSPYLRRKRVNAAAPWITGRVLDFGCGAGVLAGLVEPKNYVGVDRDETSILQAKEYFPNHHFLNTLPADPLGFDTIVALAVIEHVKNPAQLLSSLTGLLTASSASRIVITTPHPTVDWVHHLGARIGIFSSHADEEHEALLDRTSLEHIGNEAGLSLRHYSRFLLGANQLAIFNK